MGAANYIMLSFDLEEFDTPLEYGGRIPFEEQISISSNGASNILRMLDKYEIQATFYVTANYALQKPDFVKEISKKHEIASHGYFHSSFENKDLLKSRKVLEDIIGKPVYGFRMARMMPIDDNEILKAGYIYNSSLNPTYLPGRYNNFFKPRILYKNGELLNLPSSVTPIIRIPLFWLSFKNIPLWFFKLLSVWTLKTDGYLNLYFHPWEFANTINSPEYRIPKYIRRQSNKVLLGKLNTFIEDMSKNRKFISTYTYLSLITKVN